MRSLMRDAGHLRRPQPVHARADEAAWLHLLLHWPRVRRTPSSSPAAPATSAATPPRRCARPATRSVIYDNLSAGHREAALGAPLIEGDIGDVDAVRRALRDTGATAVMHFAAWLAVGDSVRDPVGYYRNNVIGTLGTLEAMAAEACRHFVFSSTCAVYGEPTEMPMRETHPTAPINAYGQTKLADRAGAAALRARLRHPLDPPALLQRRRRRPRRRARRGPRPGDPRHPARLRGGVAGDADRDLRRGLSRRRTAPACATTSTSATWPTRTCGRWRGSRRAAPSASLQRRHRAAVVGRAT